MGEADVGAGGGGLGNNDGDAPILNSVEQPTNFSYSDSGFEVKPDPEDNINPPSSSPTQSRMGGKSVPKKKGTAAAKKVPKKTRKARAKAAKKAAAAKAGVAPEEDDESSDDEIDNGPYCICRGPDDHRWMISCDACEEWYHGECINLDKELGEKLIERFVCPRCTDGKHNYTKYKKTCSLDGCTDPARLYGNKDRSVFCSNEHCDAWWASIIRTLPRKEASIEAAEMLTQEDFMGLLASTADQGGWKLGQKPFGMFTRSSNQRSWHCMYV